MGGLEAQPPAGLAIAHATGSCAGGWGQSPGRPGIRFGKSVSQHVGITLQALEQPELAESGQAALEREIAGSVHSPLVACWPFRQHEADLAPRGERSPTVLRPLRCDGHTLAPRSTCCCSTTVGLGHLAIGPQSGADLEFGRIVTEMFYSNSADRAGSRRAVRTPSSGSAGTRSTSCTPGAAPPPACGRLPARKELGFRCR
jgi:hypothetical protein